MRILLISPTLPEIGGVSIATERLSSRLKQDGHDVHVYSLSFKTPGLNNRWFRMMRFLLAPIWILFHAKFDIVHCHVAGIFRKRYIAFFKNCFHGAKLIFTLHGDAKVLRQCPVEKALKKADLIICAQNGDSAFMKQAFGVPSVDIPAFILPNNIDESEIPPSVMNFVKNGDKPLILATGGVVLTQQFYDLYGLKDIIHLYLRLKEKMPIKLLLVVTGTPMNAIQTDYIDNLCKEVKGDNNVMITKGLAMPLVPLFRYAKLFVRPTKTDGDALSIREALAMKCPVLASAVSVRPAGTLVYHDDNEFFGYAKGLLCNQMVTKFEDCDFYNQLIEAYENVLA